MKLHDPKQLLLFILTHRWPMKLALIALAFFVAVLGILAPLLQKIFVDQLVGSHSSSWSEILAQQAPLWFWLASGSVALLLSLACYQILVYLSTREATFTQHQISNHLYQHLLRLRPLDYQSRSTGEFISIYATDVPSSTILVEQSLPQGLNILFPIILTPLVLIYLFDVPALWFIPALMGFVLLNLGLAYRQSLFFYKFKELAAQRIGLVNEWIQNVRSLRIFGWIPLFEKRIYNARVEETKNRIRMLNNGQTMNAVSSSMTFALTIYILWLLQAKSKTPISPGHLLAVFWLVSVFLTRSFRQLPWFFTFLFDAWTSIRRLSSTFELGNSTSNHLTPLTASPVNTPRLATPNGESNHPEINSSPESKTLSQGALVVKNLNLKLHDDWILKNISFKIEPEEFVGLVGPVGSGKTLLLLSLLGETNATFDEYRFGSTDLLKIDPKHWRGLFSYIPQDGFLMSASLRDNLHFEYGAPISEDLHIQNCLPQVQFDMSHEGLPKGLDTIVGERGLNLSGGQKQRISLARSLMRHSPIHLFDDCLSAVDVNTEALLIQDLFNQNFKNHIRILVTARFNVLKNVSRVIYLDEGSLCGFDTAANLEQSLPRFKEFLLKAQKEQKSLEVLT